MRRYVVRRLATLPLLMVGISIISFLLLNFAPGDAAEITLKRQNSGISPSKEAVAALRQELGLDASLPVRYGRWVSDAVRGDLGESYRTGSSISGELFRRMPATLLLATTALALAVAVGIPLGILAAVKRGTWLDTACRMLALVGAAIPSYVMAPALMLLFAVKLDWLPAIGYGSPEQLILPAVALSFGTMAQLMRLTRASVLEILGQDYMRTARAKGLTETVIVWRHGLKNALLPVVTVLGTSTGYLLGGAIIIETIFGWPGVGQFMITGITQRDYPVVQGFVVYIAVIFLLVNLIVDISYRWLDPRLHFDRQAT
ncbi:MAG: nickel ABC transporter permease [Chloroflexota bacterium]|jgi:peptide/nickel transport system permease protein|nr:MAG: ABC transporter permease [SAR202 cluster bacterium]MED5207759.1 nickel ABC transporter permease [Chloroflexota bacterium]MEE3014353.1 nickel ABC transporter permease [Chloroflexota bacterium]